MQIVNRKLKELRMLHASRLSQRCALKPRIEGSVSTIIAMIKVEGPRCLVVVLNFAQDLRHEGGHLRWPDRGLRHQVEPGPKPPTED